MESYTNIFCIIANFCDIFYWPNITFHSTWTRLSQSRDLRRMCGCAWNRAKCICCHGSSQSSPASQYPNGNNTNFSWLAASGGRPQDFGALGHIFVFASHLSYLFILHQFGYCTLAILFMIRALLPKRRMANCGVAKSNGNGSGKWQWKMYNKEASVPDDKRRQINRRGKLEAKGAPPANWQTTNAGGDWVQSRVTPHEWSPKINRCANLRCDVKVRERGKGGFLATLLPNSKAASCKLKKTEN